MDIIGKHKIYHTVNRLRSFLSSCHPVIWSFDHSVTRSLGHLVTQSLGHSVTRSLCHLVTQSYSHYFQHDHERTDNIRTSRSASQTNITFTAAIICFMVRNAATKSDFCNLTISWDRQTNSTIKLYQVFIYKIQ